MPKISGYPTNNGAAFADVLLGDQVSTGTTNKFTLSNIFSLLGQGGSSLSSQIASYNNGGSAGGTFYYISLGGIKLLWGSTGSIATGGTYTVTWPTSFFSSIQSGLLTGGPVSGTNEVTTSWQSASLTTSGTIVLDAVAGSGSMPVQVFVIGT